MRFQIGKIIKYDGQYGEIISHNNNYKFLKKDIETSLDLKTNDYVLFRGEFVNGIYRAFFVKFVSKTIENTDFHKICRELTMGINE